MDVLTNVLNELHLQSTLYCRSELRDPWALYFASTKVATFHVIDRGACWLLLDDQAEPVALSSGDLIVLPHGAGHRIGTTPATPLLATIQLDQDVPVECEVQRFSEAPQTVLLCGLFDFAHENGHPLLALLPPLLHIKGEQGRAAAWLDTTLRFLAVEAGSSTPGAATLVRRLADILFIQAIRTWVMQEHSEARGWLGALRDPQIGAALSAIHHELANPWTVEALATRVAMSRSAFAARFSALVGEGPLQYLTRWRMRAAARLLSAGRLGVGEVAQHVGYVSEIAFSKAFKRTLGVSPGAYRRASRTTGTFHATIEY